MSSMVMVLLVVACVTFVAGVLCKLWSSVWTPQVQNRLSAEVFREQERFSTRLLGWALILLVVSFLAWTGCHELTHGWFVMKIGASVSFVVLALGFIF